MGKEKKALQGQLVRLMMHILKFMIQVPKRSISWINSIINARNEINNITKKKPSLKNYILEFWDTAFSRAKRDAEKETQENCDIDQLDWETVFNKKFGLDDEEK